jgi:parallel beta-helix repeat protein
MYRSHCRSISMSSMSISTSIWAGIPLGLALTVLNLGLARSPVQAQTQTMNVHAIAAVPSSPVAKNQLFVNANTGKDSTDAGRNETTPLKTISYALTQATPGTVIQVAAGQYNRETGETFPLIVPPGVTLQGNEFNQGNTVTVIGGGRVSSSWWGSQDVSILAKSSSQIVGLTVTNPNSRGTGVWIEATDVMVRGCTLTKNAREGIFAAGKSNPVIENNLFVDNSANGLAMTGLSTGMIRNNSFQRTGFGIAVSEQAAPQIVNNRVQDNVDGIVVSHSAQPQLRGNTIEGSRRDGLVMISQASPDLGNAATPGRNIFRNNGRYSIYNATANKTLSAEGNDVSGAVQLTASGPTGVDQDTPPGSQASAAPAVSAATQPAPESNGLIAAPSKTATRPLPVAPAQLQQLKKAQTIQYKGNTYVLIENAGRPAQ